MCRTRAGLGLWLAAALLLVGCAPAADPAWAQSAPQPSATPTLMATVPAATPTAAPATPTALPSPTPAPTAGPPPRVVASYPIDGDKAVPVGVGHFKIQFDRPMNPETEFSFGLNALQEIQCVWLSDSLVQVYYGTILESDTDHELVIDTTATAADGAALAEPVTIRFVTGQRGAPIPVLMYHHFAALPADATQGQRDWTVSPQALREQLAYLAEHGWHTISPTQLADYLEKQEPLPTKPLLITIDDGYKEVLDVAPLFMETDLRPVLFVVTDYVDYPAYMNWDELAALVEQGFWIGSHSMSHTDLKGASAAELTQQIADSKALLEEHLDVTVDAFCYPFGSLNKQVKQAVADSGYRTGYSLNPTIYQTSDDPLFLGRMRVDYATTLDDFIAILPD